jgi:signal transduction histidine kinase
VRSISIGKRLSLLVLTQLITAAIVVIASVIVLGQVSEQAHYVKSYVFAPLLEIGTAWQTANELTSSLEDFPAGLEPSRQSIAQLRDFISKYEREWEVWGSSVPDAQRYQEILKKVNRLSLLKEEHDAVLAFRAPLAKLDEAVQHPSGRTREEASRQRRDSLELRAALQQLNFVNLQYMAIGFDDFAHVLRNLSIFLIVVGAASMIASPLVGLSVRRAIAPRVTLLVEKVKRFRELGINEPVGPWVGDELAVLANALDVSFAAIVARDKERERFLAVAAHELKTPLTTLKGFAQAALKHRDDAALRDRALSVIDRQSTRLARLIQDLLWTASAAAGRLPFRPGPLDLEALTRRAIGEVELLAGAHRFPLTVRGETHILGDAMLLEQSLAGMLIQAASMMPPGEPVPITLDGLGAVVRLTVEVGGAELPEGDIDRLLEPFAVLSFEGREQVPPRSTGLGLHLAREIVRLHTGSLRIERGPKGIVSFVMEFPL